MTFPGSLPPSVVEVRKWTGVAESSLDDVQLARLLAAELSNQADMCRVDPYTDALYQATLRRCGRAIAARGIPLGMTPGSQEWGPTRLASFDAEIERYEGPRRKVVFG